MPAHYFSYAFLGGFLLTAFAGRWWVLPWFISTAFGIGAALLWRRSPPARLLCVAMVGCVLAVVSIYRVTHVPTAATVDTYATEQTVTIEGRIAAEPDRRPLQTKYTVAAEVLHTASGGALPVEGLVLATEHADFPRYHYGDTVRVHGELERPGTVEDFRYDLYLRRFHIYSVMYRASVDRVTQGDPSVLRMLYGVKAWFESRINRLYAEPHASFMAGLLTGSRKGIPDHLTESFNATGLTHIIAISGYNITIVVAIMSSFLFWLPLKWRLLPSVLAIIAFTLFVGASAAVVRAAIMGILGLVALQYGRRNDVRLTLLWTLFAMVAWNPMYLWYDAGFQLSFLAVAGLVELAPLLDRWCSALPQAFGVRESVQMTVAAQLSAVPLIVVLFGQFSFVAPLANVLVAPLLPFAMLFGFLGTLLSTVWFFGGQLLAYVGWGCLQWIILVAETLAHVPVSTMDMSWFSPVLTVLYYVVLGLWLHVGLRQAYPILNR